ncbi:MAG: suppressor of fused domain protein [Kofleriaceae bacterium]|nr:suppressor of fused domain protein [Kofleriaceae bacterium]
MDHARFRSYLNAIDERVTQFATIRSVYHDKREGEAHVDVYILDFTLDVQPRIVLLTVGCGLVRRGRQAAVELAMVLPATWPLTAKALKRPAVFWPFAWLRFLGANVPRLPWGPLPADLIPIRSDPRQPRVTRFEGALGVPGDWITAAFETPIMFEGTEVSVTALIPLDADELAWAAARGEAAGDGEALANLLADMDGDPLVIDEHRHSFI